MREDDSEAPNEFSERDKWCWRRQWIQCQVLNESLGAGGLHSIVGAFFDSSPLSLERAKLVLLLLSSLRIGMKDLEGKNHFMK